jgi:hypothetical protein
LTKIDLPEDLFLFFQAFFNHIHNKPAFKIGQDFGVGKTQIQNLRKRKLKVLSDFENNVPSETKRCRYLTGNEEVNTYTYEWFKDAVNRRVTFLINFKLMR